MHNRNVMLDWFWRYVRVRRALGHMMTTLNQPHNTRTDHCGTSRRVCSLHATRTNVNERTYDQRDSIQTLPGLFGFWC